MPTKSRVNIRLVLKWYFKEVEVSPMIIYDATREQIKGDSRILCDEVGCQVYKLEKDTPPANRVERYIKMIKDGAKKDLVISNSPMVFWNFYVERRA